MYTAEVSTLAEVVEMIAKGSRSFRQDERKHFQEGLLQILQQHDCILPSCVSLSSGSDVYPIQKVPALHKEVLSSHQKEESPLVGVSLIQQPRNNESSSFTAKHNVHDQRSPSHKRIRMEATTDVEVAPVVLDLVGEDHTVEVQEVEQVSPEVDLSDLKLAVVIRGELTHRIYKAWEMQLPKRLPHNRITLYTELSSDISLVVAAAGCSQDSFKTWLGKKTLPNKHIQVVSSDWIISSLKNGKLVDYKPFLLPWQDTTPLHGTTSWPSNPSEVKTKEATVTEDGRHGNSKDVEGSTATSSRTREWNKVSKFEQAYACIQTGDIKGANANKYITDILEELQNIYELTGDEWRAIGYKKCIGMLKQQPRITSMEQLKGLKGVGSSIAEKIQEILETGSLKKLKHFQNDPKIKALIELSNIWGVGEKTASDLIKKGYRSVQDLREKNTANNVLTFQQRIGLKYYEAFQIKIPRVEVEQIRDQVTTHVQFISPGSSCTVCGSYRRGKPQSGDVDILIAPPNDVDELPSDTLSKLIKSLEHAGFLTDHLALPHEYCSLGTSGQIPSAMDSYLSESVEDSDSVQKILKALPGSPIKPVQAKYRSSYMGVCKLPQEGAIHRRIDIKIYPQPLVPFAILYFTGSDHFNRYEHTLFVTRLQHRAHMIKTRCYCVEYRSMRLFAKKRGFSLSDKGLTYQEKVRFFPNVPYAIGDQVHCKTEEDIFTALGLTYKLPTDRNVFDNEHTFTEEEREEARRKPSLLGSNAYDSD